MTNTTNNLSKSTWDKLGVKTCEKCNLKTSDIGLFQAHACRRPTAVISYNLVTSLFCCSLCHIELAESAFEEHLELHLVMKPYSCYYCNEQFGTREEVYVHVKKHIDGATWQIGAETCILRVSKNTKNIMMMAKNKGTCFFRPKNTNFVSTPFGVVAQGICNATSTLTSAFPKIAPKPCFSVSYSLSKNLQQPMSTLKPGITSSPALLPSVASCPQAHCPTITPCGSTNSELATDGHHIVMHQEQTNSSNGISSMEQYSPALKHPADFLSEIPKIKAEVIFEPLIKTEEKSLAMSGMKGKFKPFSDVDNFLVLMKGNFFCLNCQQQWRHTGLLDFIKHIWLFHLHEDNSLGVSNAKFTLDSEELQSILKTLQERTNDLELSSKISHYIICKQEENGFNDPEFAIPTDASHPPKSPSNLTGTGNSRTYLKDVKVNIESHSKLHCSSVTNNKEDSPIFSDKLNEKEKENESSPRAMKSSYAAFHSTNTTTAISNCQDFYSPEKIGSIQDVSSGLKSKACKGSDMSSSRNLVEISCKEPNLEKSEDLRSVDSKCGNTQNKMHFRGNSSEYKHQLSSFYQCGFFDCVFSSHLPVDLLIHNENTHPMENEIPCVYCGKLHKTASGLLDHLNSHVGQNVIHSCSLIYNSKAEFIVDHRKRDKIFHLLKTVSERKKVDFQWEENGIQYRCNSCCSDFSSLDHLRLHLNKSVLKVVACKYCRGQFLDTESWHEHMSRDHQCEVKRYNINEKLLCMDRKLNAVTYKTLFSQRKAFRTRLYQQKSDKCDTDLTEQSENQIVENKKPTTFNEMEELSMPIYFKCSKCPTEKFSSYLSAKKHKKTHSDNEAVIRRYANYKFDPSKQYKCNYCDYICAGNKTQMLRHLRSSHKYFVCGHCGHDYAILQFLENHLKYSHQGEDKKIKERYPFLRTAFKILDSGYSNAKTTIAETGAQIVEDHENYSKEQSCSRKRHSRTELTGQFNMKRKFYENVSASHRSHDEEVGSGSVSTVDVSQEHEPLSHGSGTQLSETQQNNSICSTRNPMRDSVKWCDFTGDVSSSEPFRSECSYQLELDVSVTESAVLNSNKNTSARIARKPLENEKSEHILKETRVRSLNSPSSNEPMKICVAPYIEKLKDPSIEISTGSFVLPIQKYHVEANKDSNGESCESQINLFGTHVVPVTTHCSSLNMEKRAPVAEEESTVINKGMNASDFPFQCNSCKVYMKSIEYILDHIRWLHSNDQNNILVYDRRSRIAFTKDGLVKGSGNIKVDAEFLKQKYLCTVCNFRGTYR